jgi:hypothetical protein
MHRRAVTTVATGDADDKSHIPVTTTSTTSAAGMKNGAVVKKRRKGLSKMKRSQDFAMIEEAVLTIIQVVCVCTLIGCAFLWLKQLLPSSFFEGHDGQPHRAKHKFDLRPLKPSSIYRIPNSMSHIGDKSDAYGTF